MRILNDHDKLDRSYRRLVLIVERNGRKFEIKPRIYWISQDFDKECPMKQYVHRNIMLARRRNRSLDLSRSL